MESPYSSHKSESCDTSIFDWVALAITIIYVHITWWLFDIPKLWKHGMRSFLDAICWQCLRISMPSVAGIYAVYHAIELDDLPKIYYYGFDPNDERQPMTPFEYIKALITDTLSVIATCVTIYQACHFKPNRNGEIDASGWNSKYWAYPTLPVSLIGFWLLAVPRLKLGNIWLILTGGFFVLTIPCVAFTLVLYYLSPSRDGGIWFMATFEYLYLSLPLAFFPHVAFQLLVPALSVFARTGGVAAGALSEDASFPFCQLRNKPFGWTYLSFGILAALLAIYGRFKWDRVRYVFMPRSEWGNRKVRCPPRQDLSRHAVIPVSQRKDTKVDAGVQMGR